MTVFETGVLNIPNPNDTNLETAIQQFNQNFQLIDNYCVNKRDVFFETITINNGNSGSTLVKTTKISIVKCILTNSAINFLLPSINKDGDKFIIYDSEGLAATYNITINRNSNLINSASSNYVINKNKGWVELTYINNIGFIISNSSEIYNLLSSNNTWLGTNNFTTVDIQSLSLGSGGTTVGLEIGNSYSTGGLSFIDMKYGITGAQDFNVRHMVNGNETFLVSTATKNIYSFNNSVFSFGVHMQPTADAVLNVGSASFRVNEFWGANGSIQTSMQELKDEIEPLEIGLDFILELEPKLYKMKDIPEKKQTIKKYRKKVNEIDFNNKKVKVIGLEEYEEEEIIPAITYTRKHAGLITDNVKKVMEKLGISTKNFAGYIKDKVTGQEGLRYTEFIPILIKAMQQQNKIIQELKQEIEVLKNAK